MWAFGLILSSLPGLGITQVKAFIFIACRVHDFFFMVVGLRAINLAILLHCGYYSSVFPLMGLLAIIPAMSTRFTMLFFGLSRPIYLFFPSFYFLGLTISFLRHYRPVYFFFTSCYFHGPTNPATPAHWACFLISLPFCPLFSSYLFYCWAFSAVRPFVKMGISNMYNACENSKKELYIIIHIYLIN